MGKISEILDHYRETHPDPDYDWRFRAGRMAEEICGLKSELATLRSRIDDAVEGTVSGWKIQSELSINQRDSLLDPAKQVVGFFFEMRDCENPEDKPGIVDAYISALKRLGKAINKIEPDAERAVEKGDK